MPSGLAATRQALEFVRDELSPNTYVNLMAQWHPAGECRRFTEIDCGLGADEHHEALEIARQVGIHRLDQRLPRRLLRWL